MSPYNRMAITIVRLVAGGLVVIGVLNLALEWFKHHHDHTSVNGWRCAWLSLPLVAGAAMFIKSSALARWVDHYLDD